MKKKIFKQYFLIFMSLVLIIAVIFSSLFFFLLTKYFKLEKYQLLYNNAVNASNIVVENYNSNMKMFVNVDYIMARYNVINSSIDADVFLTNSKGEIEIYQNNKFYNKKFTVPAEIMNIVFQKGIYQVKGNLEGVYKDAYYIVALPVSLNNYDFSGAVFVATSSKDVDKLFGNMAKILIISFIVVMLISTAIILLVTNKMVLPLKEMAKMAKVFAKGDFKNKVLINQDNEIGELSLELNKMAESLEQMEDNRRYFIASVSHELKTPMTIIMGSIEAILDGLVATEDQNEYLQVIFNEVKRLSNVVTSMSNLTKIDSGQMRLERNKVNINEIIRQVVFNFDKAISNKNIKIYGLNNEDIFVKADNDLLYQVIYNLIENAIKFVNENGYIKIRYQYSADLVYVGIKNSGMGINGDDIKHIFDKFYKVDESRSMDKNGMGLGLYIVKKILKLHGSDIEVESIPNEYIEFFFWLPKYD